MTGHVTFVDGSAALGSTAVDAAGEARLSVTFLVAGEHRLRAEYGGASHLAASSAEVHHQVDRAATTAVITASIAAEAQEP